MMSNFYLLPDEVAELIKKHKIQVSTSVDGTESLNAPRHTPDGENFDSFVAENIEKLYRTSKQLKLLKSQ